MAVDDVFDDGEAKARPGLVQHLLAFDPIEAFGQPRQVRARYARTDIAHSQRHIALARRVFGREQREVSGAEGR